MRLHVLAALEATSVILGERAEVSGVGAAYQRYGDYRGWAMPYGHYDGCSAGDLGRSELDLGRRSRIDAYMSEC